MQSDFSAPRPLRDSPIFLMLVGAGLVALVVGACVLLWNYVDARQEDAALRMPLSVSISGKIEPRAWNVVGLAGDGDEFARIVSAIAPPMPHDAALVYAPAAPLTHLEMPVLRAPSDVVFVAAGKVTASVVNMPPGRPITLNFVDGNGPFSVDHVIVFAAGLSQTFGLERGRAVTFAKSTKSSS